MSKKRNPIAENTAEAMTGIALLDAYVADPAAAAAKTGPEWIKVSPRGKFTARDRRVFDVDPEALASRFEADAVDLPIDIDHSTVKRAMFGEPAPAVGWINRLEARADGLYGRVEWLEEGLRVLAARTHRYISPVLRSNDAGRVDWIHSAALVAAPAASMAAVASADLTTHPEPDMSLKTIAVLLGLTDDAAEASCLSAITTLKARIDPAVHQEALAKVSTLSAELDGIKTAGRKEKVDALLEGALAAKKITPAQRGHYEMLCASDDGLKSVTELLGTFTGVLGKSGLDDKTPADKIHALSAEDRDVMKMLGLTEDEYRKANGLTAA